MLTNPEAEEDVLGRLLWEPASWYELSAHLQPEDFASPLNGDIYRVIGELMLEGAPAEPSLIEPRIEQFPDGVTLPAFLARLKARAKDLDGVADFAEAVVEAANRRRLKALINEADKQVERAPIFELLRQVHGKTLEMMAAETSEGGHVGRISSELAQRVYEDMQSGTIAGLKTEMRFIDELTGPFLGNDLIILGGATSMGKTALGQQITMAVAEQGTPALFLSLEMSADEIATRFISHRAEVPADLIERREINAMEEQQIGDATKVLLDRPLVVQSMANATVPTLLASVMRHQRTHDIGFVAIDYLQYLRPRGRVKSEFEAITEITRDLKAAAMTTGIPWLVLAQLNRNANARANKRPQLSDLYGSSEIEKSADVVVFVHRPQYWLEGDEPPLGNPARQEWEHDMLEWKGKAEIVLAKRRRGKGRGVRQCRFREELTRFEHL